MRPPTDPPVPEPAVPESQHNRVRFGNAVIIPADSTGREDVIDHQDRSERLYNAEKYPCNLCDLPSDQLRREEMQTPVKDPTVPLVIQSEKFPWVIVVEPTEGRHYITVGDILNTLYSFLRAAATDDEIAESGKIEIIQEAAKARCIVENAASSTPCSLTIRRIDFLGGETDVIGYSRDSSFVGAWNLDLGCYTPSI